MISNSYLICESENLLKVYHKIQMHQSNAAPLLISNLLFFFLPKMDYTKSQTAFK